jgi:hypothetical protein
MEADQPNEPAASPTNHVVPVRTPEHGIKPMEGAVTSVPATDANVLDEVLEAFDKLKAELMRKQHRARFTFDGTSVHEFAIQLFMLGEVIELVTRIQNLHRIQP